MSQQSSYSTLEVSQAFHDDDPFIYVIVVPPAEEDDGEPGPEEGPMDLTSKCDRADMKMNPTNDGSNSISQQAVQVKRKLAPSPTPPSAERKEIPVSRGHGDKKLVERMVYQCPTCNFWSRQACYFHDHLMGHMDAPAFACSKCGHRSKHRHGVNLHIRLMKKAEHNGGDHEGASCVVDPGLPVDRYDGNFKVAIIPVAAKSGRFECLDTFTAKKRSSRKKRRASSPTEDDLALPEVSAQVLEEFRALAQPEGNDFFDRKGMEMLDQAIDNCIRSLNSKDAATEVSLESPQEMLEGFAAGWM